MSIKVIIERKFKNKPTTEVFKAIDELRIRALRRRGYIGGETLVSHQDPRDVLVISAWSGLEDWNAWLKDPERRHMEEALLSPREESQRIRTFLSSADYIRDVLQ